MPVSKRSSAGKKLRDAAMKKFGPIEQELESFSAGWPGRFPRDVHS